MNNVKVSLGFLIIFALLSVFAFGQENQTQSNETSDLYVTENVTETNTAITNTTEVNQTEAQETGESPDTVSVIETNQTESNVTETNVTETNMTEMVCSALQCDKGCAVCGDGSCQMPAVGCVEAIVIEKISPATVKTGEQQLNILVKNIGTVALRTVEAEISGYGIISGEKIAVEVLPAGEKDYTFTKIVVESSGTFDIVVKIAANGTVLTQEVFSLIVSETVVEEENIFFNQTAALHVLNQTREQYDALELDYYEKEKKGFIVFGIDKDLVEIKEYLRQAQVARIEENAEEFEQNIVAARELIEAIVIDLAHAQKEDKTFMEILSENLALIGSLFGVLISGITVWSMTKVHLKKAKIVNIIKGKQIVNVDKNTEIENIIDHDDKKAKDL